MQVGRIDSGNSFQTPNLNSNEPQRQNSQSQNRIRRVTKEIDDFPTLQAYIIYSIQEIWRGFKAMITVMQALVKDMKEQFIQDLGLSQPVVELPEQSQD
jgi:hypothetical protein